MSENGVIIVIFSVSEKYLGTMYLYRSSQAVLLRKKIIPLYRLFKFRIEVNQHIFHVINTYSKIYLKISCNG
jgi:hypothetical protein